MKIANLANIRQGISKNSNEMTKWPFESGDFDENGEICVNDEYGEQCQQVKRDGRWFTLGIKNELIHFKTAVTNCGIRTLDAAIIGDVVFRTTHTLH